MCAQRPWARGGCVSASGRCRTFSAVRTRHVIEGPEFVEMFERISVLQVDDCFQASCVERDATVQEVALWRPFGSQVGCFLGAGANERMSLDDPLAPSARFRFQSYRRAARAGRLRSGTGLAANIGHNPDVRPRLRCRVQARSGTLELRWSAATSSRCETTLRPMIAG